MAVSALACAGATAASAATSLPAGPASLVLAGHLQAAAQDSTLPIYDVQIVMDGTNLCLDAENDSGGNPGQNGDKVQLWTCNSGAPQQRWDITMSAGGGGTIVNEDGGLCLDAETDSGANPTQYGDKVQLWTCSGADQQQWSRYDPENDGYHQFTNEYPDSGLNLAAENDSGGTPSCGDNILLGDTQTWDTF